MFMNVCMYVIQIEGATILSSLFSFVLFILFTDINITTRDEEYRRCDLDYSYYKLNNSLLSNAYDVGIVSPAYCPEDCKKLVLWYQHMTWSYVLSDVVMVCTLHVSNMSIIFVKISVSQRVNARH